ncbi:bifunctional UDP-N-acetylglucosamine diphosphorylase/glucosamine-1-phosphate N-acetyltransferase GlmU [soil metagenome]
MAATELNSAPRAVVILAAGQGTRMRALLPKVLHPVGGRAMLDRAIDAAQGAGAERVVVVAGAHSPEVAAHARKRLGEAAVAIQDPPLGTGHAVRAAETALAGFEGVVAVTYADAPLVDAAVVGSLFETVASGAKVAVLGFRAKAPGAYGRLVLGEGASLERIVEAKDATSAELALDACNSGLMAARSDTLFSLLAKVTNANKAGEYYLTDVVGLARNEGLRVDALFADEETVMGVNSQGELAEAEAAFQRGRRSELMTAGVRMTAPETGMLSHDTQIAPGAVVEPFVVFGQGVSVAAGAVIKSFSHLEGATVAEGALIGPYARLRPGAEIGSNAHIGNFVEVKKTSIGEGAKANHLAYLGDGEVGAGANIGAGVIFCNYDGFDKHRTVVGAGAFVGSDAALVAPVTIGAGAYVGSGSVITKDVAPDALALERSVQVEKPGWAAAFRAAKKALKA